MAHAHTGYRYLGKWSKGGEGCCCPNREKIRAKKKPAVNSQVFTSGTCEDFLSDPKDIVSVVHPDPDSKLFASKDPDP